MDVDGEIVHGLLLDVDRLDKFHLCLGDELEDVFRALLSDSEDTAVGNWRVRTEEGYLVVRSIL